MGDPRISQALSVLLGIDLTTMAGGADDDQMDTDENPRSAEPERPPPPTSTFSSSTKKADPRARTKDLTAEQSKAWDEKDLGNECYKKKDFDNALKHYDTAIELDPQNITHQTNKAGKSISHISMYCNFLVSPFNFVSSCSFQARQISGMH